RCQVGFCLGSQRAMLNGDEEVRQSFQLRKWAPKTLIIGNIGAVQLRDEVDGAKLADLADAAGADAMYVHLNALQEAVQPEGDRDWRGIHAAIARVAGTARVPLLVKEVGAGLGASTLEALAATGVAGVETAGVGGTSWARIEALRHTARTPQSIAGTVLAGFGTPTAISVQLARRAFPSRLVIASGGLRDGLQVAKCISLGADTAAMAYPFLVAARQKSQREAAVEAVVNEIEGVLETLRITMFLVGAPSLSHLRKTPLFPSES
ncbi:MAG TPA: type 2 isopentenyl-diphosphate Delta-isomerase, partial [Myxococcales bacterium]|nr:type 2 isopentenyl-diphosphate Delta-isomerase [Myxococcales bacterium]